MQFYESLLTDDRPAGLVDVDADLFLRLVSSFQKDGDRAKIDLASLEALYTDTADRSRRGRSRIVVVDGCRIFIDGQRVEGLTRMGTRILARVFERGGAVTVDDLQLSVWTNPLTNPKTIMTQICYLNAILRNYGCRLVRSGVVGYRLCFDEYSGV